MSPETVTPESQPPTAFQEFSWVPGKNHAWDSACVRLKADGRVYVGLKGFDKHHGRPGYIAVELTAKGLRRLAALLADAQVEKAAASDDPEDLA